MFGNDWDQLLAPEFEKEYFKKLQTFLTQERANHTVFPPENDVFNALRYTAYQDVKVVLLGQDPYHGEGQAHGLAFSVQPGVEIPPSLLNMYKELQADLGIPIASHGCLIPWAKQGVLLLNTALTVREGEANSHRGKGWEVFTDRIIELLNKREKPMVFLLWGRNAAEKETLITNLHHMVLKAPHPSPLSANRGFFGCRHFSKTNAVLRSCGEAAINWEL